MPKTAECYCGAAISQIRLPDSVLPKRKERTFWVHDDTNDTRCYTEGEDTAEDIFADPVPSSRWRELL